MKKVVCVCLIICFTISSLIAAGKDDFPGKKSVITIVCPNSAGGGTDLMARALAEAIEHTSSVSVVVQNITGNSTAKGTNDVLAKPADGYTLLIGGSHVISSTMQNLTAGYKGLTTIAALNEDPYIIAVEKKSPYRSFREFETKAKANPGSLILGNAGNGSGTGAASIGLSLALNKEFAIHEYSGGAELYKFLLAHSCDAGIFSQSEIATHANTLRPLAILSSGHSTLPSLSSLPTLRDLGYTIAVPGFSFRSVMVRKETKDEIRATLAGIIEKAYYYKSFQEYQKNNGLIQVFSKLTKAELFNDDLIAAYKPILKQAGLYLIND